MSARFWSSRSRALGLVCVGTIAVLASSGCSGSDPEPDPTSSPNIIALTATPSPDDGDPTNPIAPSLAAGIPTAEPSPTAAQDATSFDASATITLATVDPDTGELLVGGYVSGVMEDGGDCQYVITASSGDSFTVDTEGVANNGSTSCGSMTVARSQAPAGSYTVRLLYASDSGEARSDAVEVEVS